MWFLYSLSVLDFEFLIFEIVPENIQFFETTTIIPYFF